MSISELETRPEESVHSPGAAREPALPANPSEPPLIWAILQILALSLHVPLAVTSGPQQAMVGVGSAATVGLMVAAVCIAAYLLIKSRARSGWIALGWTSVGIVFFWHWEGLSPVGSLPHWIVSIAILALCLTAVTRVAEKQLFRRGLFVVAVTYTATLLLMTLQVRVTTPDPIVTTNRDVVDTTLGHKPDIVFIVLDAYARDDILQSVYGFDNADMTDELESAGFTVPSSANSNYGSTHFSVSSMLEMEYLAEPRSEISNSDLESLTDMISGSNELIDVLKANGYTYVHGDTDHWLNTCGPEVDRCEHGPVIDVTGDALLAGTPVGPLLYRREGDPTTALNVARLGQLENWAEFEDGIESPSFTFLHLVLPHPPLYLDSTCQPRPDPLLDGRNVSQGEYSDDELAVRRDAYVEQVQCANLAIRGLIDAVDPNAAVIITADHGPDSFQPLSRTEDTTPEQAWERFAVFTAMRLPQPCDRPSQDHQMVNTFRILIGCLSESPMEMLDKRYFIATYGGPIEELKDPDMSAESQDRDKKDQTQ